VPYLVGAYELVAYAGQPVMALSGGHANLPGAKQVFRDELTGEDILALRGEPTPARHFPLLRPVMTAGSRVVGDDEHGPADDVAAAHRRFEADLARLAEQTRRFDHPAPMVPTVSVALRRLHDQLHERLVYRQLLDPGVTGPRTAQRPRTPARA
jgi:nicotinate phosphoribosyltransferase